MKHILDDLHLGTGEQFQLGSIPSFRTELAEAVDDYSAARAEALRLLYKNKETSRARSAAVAADFEESECWTSVRKESSIVV